MQILTGRMKQIFDRVEIRKRSSNIREEPKGITLIVAGYIGLQHILCFNQTVTLKKVAVKKCTLWPCFRLRTHVAAMCFNHTLTHFYFRMSSFNKTRNLYDFNCFESSFKFAAVYVVILCQF